MKHIIFVDNGSTDGTVEIAAQHQPVSVYTTTAPFRDRNFIRQSMARRFGDGHWTLYLDIDERFDYPHSRALRLAELINYLNRRGFSAVVGHMVDLFPREALLRPDEAAEARDIYSYHAFYSIDGLRIRPYKWQDDNIVSNPTIRTLYAGVRGLVFDIPWLLLTKHPLFFIGAGARPWETSSHSIRGAHIADLTTLVFHIKFSRLFSQVLSRALTEKQYWNDSSDYRAYERVLRASPDLRLWGPTSRHLSSSDDLIGTPFVTGGLELAPDPQ